MPTPRTYTRMLAPPDYQRRVDVAGELIDDRIRDGWRPDPAPDRRASRYRDWVGHARGRPAYVIANGPSAGDVDPDSFARVVVRTGGLVVASNAAWMVPCLASLPRHRLPFSPLLVILDEPFFEEHSSAVRLWLEPLRPKGLLALCFDPPTVPVGWPTYPDYLGLPLDIAVHAHDAPAYSTARLYHGESSGCAALQMALHSGASPIYLIGHDCRVIGDRTHAWGVRSVVERADGYRQGKGMIAGYDLASKHAASIGVPVFNLSEHSALTCFSYRDPNIVFPSANRPVVVPVE